MMGADSHLIEYRFPSSLASLIARLHLDQKRAPFSIPVDWFRHLFVHRMTFGRGRGCVLIVLICFTLMWPLVVFSQEIDEGEFSPTMLDYKLQLVKKQFEQTEMKLLTRSATGPITKNLEHVHKEIKCLEAKFRCGKYYPDLLDEQIVNIREELRLILADPARAPFIAERGSLSDLDQRDIGQEQARSLPIRYF
jgi:hypothetical protein